MVQNIFQPSIYELVTTIYLWINLPYLKWHSIHHLASISMSKYHLDLHRAPAYFQELTTGILKDFYFAIAYLDDIIIFSTAAEEHLSHIKQV